ncbi:hypothetical protein KKF84_22135 [Myxococcota bacterium]|nr:hypothetical protein [Myxococcota bacterium]MBU1538028.1 hypothetical protein [Myxococcota bacterium]
MNALTAMIHSRMLNLFLVFSVVLPGCFYQDTSRYANHGDSTSGSQKTNNPPLLDAPPPPPAGSGGVISEKQQPEDVNDSTLPGAPVTTTSISETPEQLAMAAYHSSTGNYSLLYPKGWSIKALPQIISFYKDKKNRSDAQMHILTIKYPRRIKSATAISVISGYLKRFARDFTLKSTFDIRGSSKCRAIAFTFSPGGVPMEGFAMASTHNRRVIYAMVFGPKKGFPFNGPLTLGYMLQSFTTGATPRKPSITLDQLRCDEASAGHMGIANFEKTIKASLSL